MENEKELKMRLKLVMEASEDYAGDGKTIISPEVVSEILNSMGLNELDQEVFAVIGLNIRNRLMYSEIVTIGIGRSTVIDVSSVFRGAIVKGAHAIIVGHNHPSGDATPSSEDIKLTKSLRDAGDILGVPLLDHIIVPHRRGPGNIMSLRESGLVVFKD